MRILIFFILFLAPFLGFSKNYFISDAASLNNLKLKAGDTVILKNGSWKNQQLHFKGLGTAEKPIILKAEKDGQVSLEGNSNLKIDGVYLTVSGLQFINGFSLKVDVIAFTTASKYCRLTNSAIINYNPTDKTIDYKWISLYGEYNRVDHCYIKGKTHQGTTLVVWLSDQPNHHQIDHNYFGERPALGVNGGETIRIGTSTWSMYDSFTVVENNIFDKCDGEAEIISNKSCKNLIQKNLFFECDGTLTLRHGNSNEVANNYFIGNHKKGSGGIRIIGENQNVHHNYLIGLSGKDLRAAISIMNGIPKSPLNGYWQVKSAKVNSNIIVNCEEGFNIGSGKSDKNTLPPVQVDISNNILHQIKKPLIIAEQKSETQFSDNTIAQKLDLREFKYVSSRWFLDNLGLRYPTRKKILCPFWLTENIGVNFISLNPNNFKVNN